jgi:hypothetical protein
MEVFSFLDLDPTEKKASLSGEMLKRISLFKIIIHISTDFGGYHE